MCGIAGIVSLDGAPADPRALKRMCDVLAHRGPDDAGYAFFHPSRRPDGRGADWSAYCDPAFRHINEHLPVFGRDDSRSARLDHEAPLALGHRRLAILDLSEMGHQPMCTADRRFWIVYNGESYNFPELRLELESKGYVFRTGTDTEVILHLWEEEGEACLQRLDGMFAFALYDREQNRLTLARDRFGVKPLYYAHVDGRIIFASEAKALFASGLVDAQLDPASLVEYCTFQNVFGERTLWRDVHILEPGCSMHVSPGRASNISRTRFHRLRDAIACEAMPEGDAASTVAEGFQSAVRRQLVSDVPVGSYLSGGMDSGSIVAVAGAEINRLHTFTGGFDLTNVNGIEQGFDERRLAERLSYLLQTEHYDVVLHAGDMPAAMERLSWHMDDPRVGMCHQNWYVAKLASRFVKVCLAGTGGDELFAGYPWRYKPAFLHHDESSFDEALFQSWHRLLPPDELRELFTPDLHEHLDAPRASFDAVLADAPQKFNGSPMSEHLLQRAMYFEYRTFLHGLLVTDDHISMAHSLETRVPFLDNSLASLAWRLPVHLKLRMQALKDVSAEDYIDSSDGKLVLRRAMERYLPREFLYQKKQGFSPPDANWYRGPSMDYIKSILFDDRTRQRPWFNHDVVERKLHEHFEGRRNQRLLIWSLLSLEWIQRHFVDQSQAVNLAEPELRPSISINGHHLRRMTETQTRRAAPAQQASG